MTEQTTTEPIKPVIEIKHRYTGAVLFRSETARSSTPSRPEAAR